MSDEIGNYISAIHDFHRARNRAALKQILSIFTGESIDLLSFEEVVSKLKLRGSSDRGLQDIPVDAIVGSVGRYTDFTRDFLPRQKVDEERWARVKVAATSLEGLPPIEVYKIGDAYFVRDGNHRVSVARQLGATHIQAYVTEIRTRVPLDPDTQPDELILKSEYADFLERTRLDELRPEADLTVTVPGQYPILAEHIAVHRYFMGIDQQRYIPNEEAVTHWYDTVYLPVAQVIRELGVLNFFPGRTETDLYLWIAEHRAALEKEIGWEVNTEAAASDLVSQFSSKPGSVVSRLGGRLIGSMPLSRLEPGPPPGQWRKERQIIRRDERLFSEILVPVNGEESGWFALEQAIVVAQREDAFLRGLHVVPDEQHVESEPAQAVRSKFNRRCAQAGIAGELVLAAGEVSRQICSRSRWTDLIVTALNYPPEPHPLARLSPGFSDLIRRCPRPILATPKTASALNHALLAYDGSPKAEEALYVATYLAGKWQIPLVVVCVVDNARVNRQTLERARDYLQSHLVQADYVLESGSSSEKILKVGDENESDLLIMGGYGYNPVLEVVLGSVVDQVLRESHKPILICR